MGVLGFSFFVPSQRYLDGNARWAGGKGVRHNTLTAHDHSLQVMCGGRTSWTKQHHDAFFCSWLLSSQQLPLVVLMASLPQLSGSCGSFTSLISSKSSLPTAATWYPTPAKGSRLHCASTSDSDPRSCYSSFLQQHLFSQVSCFRNHSRNMFLQAKQDSCRRASDHRRMCKFHGTLFVFV